MEQAYSHKPDLVPDAAGGRVSQTPRHAVRTDPDKRADRFVEQWRKLDGQYRGDYDAIGRARSDMAGLAKSHERGAQMESLLRGRSRELGLDLDIGRKLSHDLASSVGIEMGRGLGTSR